MPLCEEFAWIQSGKVQKVVERSRYVVVSIGLRESGGIRYVLKKRVA